MKNPCHPGEIIREELLAPLGLTVTEAARVLGVARPTLSNLLNEHAALTAEMALRIEKAFGPSMDHLMRMQLAYDLAKARRQEKALNVKRYRRRRTARGLVTQGRM
jgi:addiction module HigA family antidote